MTCLRSFDYNAKNDELNLKGIYNARQELGGNFRTGALQTFGQTGGVGPNGLTKKTRTYGKVGYQILGGKA
ncbi:hypothetical protein NQ314_021467 [Rhamnusium bicolor]|uniref:Uncharacterized protein n=1 Tax=Rhamnusium bicolor TaxID=1586634 RepID=A0AAV8WI35_9CUCU|nr:hypothetical protein NQ314_021467 [Rhamnusium bicolor]